MKWYDRLDTPRLICEIVTLLGDEGPLSAGKISILLHMPIPMVKQLLKSMTEAGVAHRTSSGIYRAGCA